MKTQDLKIKILTSENTEQEVYKVMIQNDLDTNEVEIQTHGIKHVQKTKCRIHNITIQQKVAYGNETNAIKNLDKYNGK